MSDDYENKPVSLITPKEREEDSINQAKLLQELIGKEKTTPIVCLFNCTLDDSISFMSFCLTTDKTIGSIQTANPSRGLYAQRFYVGHNKTIRCYKIMKKNVLNRPDRTLIWEGEMNDARWA